MKTLSLNVVALYTWFLGPMPYSCDNIGSYHSTKGNISATARPRKPRQVAQAKSSKRPCINTAVDVPTDIHVLSSDEDDVDYVSTKCSESYDSDGTSDTTWPNEVASEVLPSNNELFF